MLLYIYIHIYSSPAYNNFYPKIILLDTEILKQFIAAFHSTATQARSALNKASLNIKY